MQISIDLAAPTTAAAIPVKPAQNLHSWMQLLANSDGLARS